MELNTIASSFGCLSTLVARMHRHLLARLGCGEEVLAALPPNDTMAEIADAMGAAAADYDATSDGSSGSGPPAVMLMIVQPGERNAYDQQWLQAALWERHGVRTLRRTLAQVEAEGRLVGGGDDSSSSSGSSEGGGRLEVGGHPVSVVYFRAGYTPADYPSAAEWRARVVIESCDAFKCPTVAYQLAGAKKIQQVRRRRG